jgi:hypothetical protein
LFIPLVQVLAASQHISQNYFITKQLIAVGLGLVTFTISCLIPISIWRKIALPLVIIALLGCAIVMITPINAMYPAHRWIRLGGFSFQIAELIKLALLVWLASFLADKYSKGQLSNSKAVLQPLVILVFIVGAVMAKLQSDLRFGGSNNFDDRTNGIRRWSAAKAHFDDRRLGGALGYDCDFQHAIQTREASYIPAPGKQLPI